MDQKTCYIYAEGSAAYDWLPVYDGLKGLQPHLEIMPLPISKPQTARQKSMLPWYLHLARSDCPERNSLDVHSFFHYLRLFSPEGFESDYLVFLTSDSLHNPFEQQGIKTVSFGTMVNEAAIISTTSLRGSLESVSQRAFRSMSGVAMGNGRRQTLYDNKEVFFYR